VVMEALLVRVIPERPEADGQPRGETANAQHDGGSRHGGHNRYERASVFLPQRELFKADEGLRRIGAAPRAGGSCAGRTAYARPRLPSPLFTSVASLAPSSASNIYMPHGGARPSSSPPLTR
jgi:hypothetical protein